MLVYGLIVLAILILVGAAWYGWYRARGKAPPEEQHEDDRAPHPPEGPWDPRERYDDGEPPPAAQG
jgi:hypothetical protein